MRLSPQEATGSQAVSNSSGSRGAKPGNKKGLNATQGSDHSIAGSSSSSAKVPANRGGREHGFIDADWRLSANATKATNKRNTYFLLQLSLLKKENSYRLLYLAIDN